MNRKPFEQWLREVNAECIKRVGLSYEDLTDVSYRDMYDDGVSPSRAAQRAIKASGGE